MSAWLGDLARGGLWEKAARVRDGLEYEALGIDDRRDTVELIETLARVMDGIPWPKAFDSPGDWGYATPIGNAEMKANDLVNEIRLLKFDKFRDKALNRTVHASTRISVVVTSSDDSHHIQFPEPVTRLQLACLLRGLADSICPGACVGMPKPRS